MDLNERVNKYNEEHKKLLEDLSLDAGIVLEFPGKKKIPYLSKIAILILLKQGFSAAVKVSDLKK